MYMMYWTALIIPLKAKHAIKTCTLLGISVSIILKKFVVKRCSIVFHFLEVQDNLKAIQCHGGLNSKLSRIACNLPQTFPLN